MTHGGHDLIAVIDVGKTNTKLSILDAGTGAPIQVLQRANAPVSGGVGGRPMRQLDLGGIEQWLFAQLRGQGARDRISAILPVAHGAACVLLDGQGRVIAAPDYEESCFRETAIEYDRLRSPFSETQSPRLPDGLNVGAQLHYLQTRCPEAFAQVALILPLPQYWAWRFSSVAACEVSSLGAHSDLWQPARGCFSGLVGRCGWTDLFPPLREASAVLGTVQPEVLQATGLPTGCRVYCGVHDSNASWLAHLRDAEPGADLTVISSGTWTIAMKNGADLGRLREERDMLANVDVFGSPVATARFMGGREYALVAGNATAAPTFAGLQRVIDTGAMALPSFTDSGGPYPGRPGRLVGAENLSERERAALASIYVALMVDELIGLLGPSRNIIVDGPLASNPLFPGLLKALRPEAVVALSTLVSGAAAGALALVLGDATPARAEANYTVGNVRIAGLAAYRDAWRKLVTEHAEAA